MTSDILKAAALQAAATILESEVVGNVHLNKMGMSEEMMKSVLKSWYEDCLSIVDAEPTQKREQKSEVKMHFVRLEESLHKAIFKVARGDTISINESWELKDRGFILEDGHTRKYSLSESGKSYIACFDSLIPF